MKVLLAFAPVTLAGCVPPEPTANVAQILAQCDSFKGKSVRVAGYLGECAGYECHLAVDRAGWNAFVEAFNHDGREFQLVSRGAKPAHEARFADRQDSLIGIGGDEAFDRKAKPLQHSYVVITGRVADDTCTGAGGTDRSAGIEPTDIRAWSTSEGAPANTQ